MDDIKLKNISAQVQKYNYLKCPQYNSVQFFCINPKCNHFAFVCRQQNCKCITEKHLSCKLIRSQYIIQKVHFKQQNLPDQIEEVIQQTMDIYQQMIQTISLQRQKMLDWKQMFGLNQYQINFINMMKNNQYDHQKINGKFFSAIYLNIQNRLRPFQDYKKAKSKLQQQINWNFQKDKFNKVLQKLSMVQYPKFAQKFNFTIFGQPESFQKGWNFNHQKKILKFFGREVYSFSTFYSFQALPYQGKVQVSIQMKKINRNLQLGVIFGKIFLLQNGRFPPSSWRRELTCQSQSLFPSKQGKQKKYVVKMVIDRDFRQINWFMNDQLKKTLKYNQQVKQQYCFLKIRSFSSPGASFKFL